MLLGLPAPSCSWGEEHAGVGKVSNTHRGAEPALVLIAQRDVGEPHRWPEGGSQQLPGTRVGSVPMNTAQPSGRRETPPVQSEAVAQPINLPSVRDTVSQPQVSTLSGPRPMPLGIANTSPPWSPEGCSRGQSSWKASTLPTLQPCPAGSCTYGAAGDAARSTKQPVQTQWFQGRMPGQGPRTHPPTREAQLCQKA